MTTVPVGVIHSLVVVLTLAVASWRQAAQYHKRELSPHFGWHRPGPRAAQASLVASSSSSSICTCPSPFEAALGSHRSTFCRHPCGLDRLKRINE
jgi:hypothetical protein